MDSREAPFDRAHSPSLGLIFAWADAFSIELSEEEAEDLRRRIQGAAVGFEWDADSVERVLTDAIDWMADRVRNPAARRRLRESAAGVSAAFVAAGLVRAPRYVVAPRRRARRDSPRAPRRRAASGRPKSAGPNGCVGGPAHKGLIYENPVAVAIEGKGAGVVRHPAHRGRVRVCLHDARPQDVPVDDLTPESRSALRSRTRRRVEVCVACTEPGCSKAFRAFLTPEGHVEDVNGEPIAGLDRLGLLFHAVCDGHRDQGSSRPAR